jgi:hypothetical protein
MKINPILLRTVRKSTVLLFLTSFIAKGQTTLADLSFKIGLQLEQVALPGISGLKYGLNPGILVGAEYQYKTNSNITLFQSLEYSFTFNRHFGSSNVLTTHFGPKFIYKQSQISLGLGGGYNLFKPKNPIYTLNQGEYLLKRTQGKWLAGALASYGHQFGKIIPFASYSFYVDSPFINSNSSILPHQLLQFGVKMTSH